MKQSVIILGAKGRFGRTATTAFLNAGWNVTALARSWGEVEPHPRVKQVTGSAFHKEALSKACIGHDVIVNAINPPYQDWKHVLPLITENVIAAGLVSNATIMVPGNIYNYGNELPAIINETTPHVPNFPKGRLRIKMEQDYQEASKQGLRTIVLRSGDYFEKENTGDWFQSQIVSKLHKGVVTYPGPLNVIHSWAYLPDKARAMVALAEKRQSFEAFEEFILRGYALTGQELIEAIRLITGSSLHVKRFPWSLLQFLKFFSPFIREVVEMRYLWNRPHELEDTKFRNVIPNFETTPINVAITNAVGIPSEKAQLHTLAKIDKATSS